jgi:allose kinase
MSTLLVADIGGTTVKIGLVVDSVPQEYVRLFPSSELRTTEAAMQLAHMIATVIAESQLKPDRIVATVPGFLDRTAQHVLFAANLPQLNGCALASELTRATDIPVTLERDAVLSLMGEYAAGACAGSPSVLGIFFGTGVGASYLEDGHAFRGSGWALELGHMPYRGEHRWLGEDRPECLEGYVSGKVLEQIAYEHGVHIGQVFSAASDNTPLAEHVNTFIRDQANAVAAAIAFLSPQTVLLGGGICEMPSFPKGKLVSTIEASFPFRQIGQTLDLRWAQLGWKSVLHGAARVAAQSSAGS